MEFLERFDSTHEEERWIVRSNGETRVAWVLVNEDREWLAKTERATRALHGDIHPRIATIYSSSWQDNRLVFETRDDRGPTFFDAAESLTDPIERERWAVAQIIGMADAIATARQRDRNFIHGQIEPAKMFVDESGHACLRAPIAYVLRGPRPMRTGVGIVTAMPDFMAPEQAAGRAVTAATDVFALAGNLYRALCGRPPFGEADSPMQRLQAILTEPPAPIATHANLAKVFERAFAKSEQARTPDAGTFAGELWQCVPDAMEYDAVISDKIVAWRANQADVHVEQLFNGYCKQQWEQLAPTPNADVRACGNCAQQVVRVRSIAELVVLGGGQCVHYTGGS